MLRGRLERLASVFDDSNRRTTASIALMVAIFWWASPKIELDLFEKKEFIAVVSALFLWTYLEYDSRKPNLDATDKVLSEKILSFYSTQMEEFLKKHHFGNSFHGLRFDNLHNFREQANRSGAVFSIKHIQKQYEKTIARCDELISYFHYADEIGDKNDISVLKISPEMYPIEEKHLKDLPEIQRDDFKNHLELKTHQRFIISKKMGAVANQFADEMDKLVLEIRKVDPEIYTNNLS